MRLQARAEKAIDRPPAALNSAQEQARIRVLERYRDGTFVTVPVSCLCGSDGTIDVTIAERDRFGLPSPSVLCGHCGIVRTTPRLEEASLNQFYNEHYRSLYSGSEVEADEFFEKQIHKGASLKAFLDEALLRGSNIADIGCGAGGLLIPFRDAGHSVQGCDLGYAYLDRGRQEGLDLRHGPAATLSDSAPFDLIILSHIVEHVPDPIEFLKSEVLTMLGPDGLIFIELPCLRGISRYGDPLRYFQNAHLWNFDLASLSAIAAAAGLQLQLGNEWIRALFRRGQIRFVEPDPVNAVNNLRAVMLAERYRSINLVKQSFRRALRWTLPSPFESRVQHFFNRW